jgi:orotate phosphoribosyltransferase
VSHALVIVDRDEQDGRAQVEAQGAKVLSLLTIKDLLAVNKV